MVVSHFLTRQMYPALLTAIGVNKPLLKYIKYDISAQNCPGPDLTGLSVRRGNPYLTDQADNSLLYRLLIETNQVTRELQTDQTNL